MVFSSAVFLFLFLPIVFIMNFFIKKGTSNLFLLLSSLFFYAWGEPYLVLLMVFSIVINFLAGLLISNSEGNIRKAFLVAGVALNLAFLGYYKYSGFFVSTLNDIAEKKLFDVPNIELPIGISFFTFQAISYIADVYRNDTRASKNIVNTALYISFFPQLIAGPIVKYRDINKQIEKRSLSFDKVSSGFKRFIYGLGKKVLISNTLGLCVDTIYSYDASLIDTKMAIIGAVCYTFQIYYDFSGYSDMAIGLGKMFGFDILENFNYPYLSKSITEFWRRWHISLGSWFREYVYIPLGGNRKGKGRTYFNLFIVFLLTGLWHGADMSFVLWGIYHGFFTIIERLGFKKILAKSKIIGFIYTFIVVNLGWVLFRADNTTQALRYLRRMLMPWKYNNVQVPMWKYFDEKTFFIGICAVLGMGILKRTVPEKISNKYKDSVLEAVYCIVILGLCMASIASDTYNPFIYFQF